MTIQSLKLHNSFLFDISNVLSLLVSQFPAHMDDRNYKLSQQTDMYGNIQNYTISFFDKGSMKKVCLDGDRVIHIDKGDGRWVMFDDHGCRNFEAAMKYIQG